MIPTCPTGVGYGGDAKTDCLGRKTAKLAAMKRETQSWKAWQLELESYINSCTATTITATTNASTTTTTTITCTTKKRNAATTASPTSAAVDSCYTSPSYHLLDILKQVLRQTPEDWWFQQPQRQLYVVTIQVCDLLTEHHPQSWGDEDDTESAITAFATLYKTSSMLLQQLLNNNNNNKSTSDVASLPVSKPQIPVTKRKSSNNMPQSTHDEDPTLPLQVQQSYEKALVAVKQVIVQPEVGIMDSTDYYRKTMRPLAFGTVESFVKPPHSYSTSSSTSLNMYTTRNSSTNMGLDPKKSKTLKNGSGTATTARTKLWKELSTYPTALPIEYGSSIFVRTLENDMDKLRVLIIGPDGAPYANGCFLFDVTMGSNYPHSPPKVKFLTTSSFCSVTNHKVRFNPNLYADGKVCLSLLGTWSGPGWQPNESTLLQVLVSIQSLILVDDPYFNEPGYERSKGTKHGQDSSTNYNRTIRQQTLQIAILPFLQNQLQSLNNNNTSSAIINDGGQTSTGYFDEFSDIIRHHFRLKHKDIQTQLFSWLQEDKSLENMYTEFWNVWDQIEQVSAISNSKCGNSAAARRAAKRAKVTSSNPSAAIEMTDEVIILDNDDDDDDNDDDIVEIQEVIQMTVSDDTTTCIGSGGGEDDAIELVDSDDEDDVKMSACRSPLSSCEMVGSDVRQTSSKTSTVVAKRNVNKNLGSLNSPVILLIMCLLFVVIPDCQ